nr:reverse transcriptase/maturase family protein [uncultured Bacillus sp.]
MQNSEVVLYNLSKQARKEDYRFDRLYRNLYNKEFYIKAYLKTSKNKGNAIQGIDEERADGFEDEKIESIIASLKDETYQPKPIKRVNIPKKSSKTRPLASPTFTDRMVQEVCRMMLEAIYEPIFSEFSHGFRKNHSCHTALVQIQNTFTGVNWFVEGDIKGFFDQINHRALINILRKKISDERFIRLIWKFLRSGYLEDWEYNQTYSGTPRGGIVSPILANIYLNEFDNYVTRKLKQEFDQGEQRKRKQNTEYRKYNMKHQGINKKNNGTTDEEKREAMMQEYQKNKKLSYYEPENQGYKSIKYVRYADDFLIGVNGSKEDCLQIKNIISKFLSEKLELEMSEEKTLIKHSSKPARFLEYDITVSKDKSSLTAGSSRGYVQLRIPKETMKRIIIDSKMVKDIDAKQWDMLHRPRLLGLSDLEIVQTYNAELSGLYHYYSLAENVSKKMWQLRYVMEYSCLKTLANKYKSTVAKMKTKYKQGKYWGIKYQTKHGEKIAYFYKDGFNRQKISRKRDVDIKPHLYVNKAKQI